jgi:hypothetical protein
MTRRPPTIVSVTSTADGGLEAEWEVDAFFGDAEPPERVTLNLNGILYKEFEADETSAEIPAEQLAGLGSLVTISVSFWWDGSPNEEQQSSIVVPINQGSVPPPTGVHPASRAVVRLVRVQPRTLAVSASITVAWRGNNYNGANLYWGPTATAPAQHARGINPVGERYEGEFTTDQPVLPSTQYTFRVDVRNTLHSPNWLSTTIIVRSAPGGFSVREFLIASNRPPSTGLASLVGPDKSIHKMLLG